MNKQYILNRTDWTLKNLKTINAELDGTIAGISTLWGIEEDNELMRLSNEWRRVRELLKETETRLKETKKHFKSLDPKCFR